MEEILIAWVITVIERRPPTFGLRHTRWDETGERLTLDAVGSRNVWQIFICRVRCMWGWYDNNTNTWEIQHWDFIVNPVALVSCAAEHLYDTFQHHKSLKLSKEFGDALLRLALSGT